MLDTLMTDESGKTMALTTDKDESVCDQSGRG
jgi:hypothetical protein